MKFTHKLINDCLRNLDMGLEINSPWTNYVTVRKDGYQTIEIYIWADFVNVYDDFSGVIIIRSRDIFDFQEWAIEYFK